MTDDRFHAFDALDPPDRWTEIVQRSPQPGVPGVERPAAHHRLLLVAVVVVALAVITGAAIAVTRGGDPQVVRSAGGSGVASAPATSTPTPPTPTTPTAPATSAGPVGDGGCTIGPGIPSATPGGEVAGQVTIDAINLRNFFYVDGTDLASMQKGIGHQPGSPGPGQAGNAVLVGHRTTYGAPFHNLDQLHAGDRIVVTSPVGDATYLTRSIEVVDPNDTAVLADFGDDRLTLVTCEPKFSAKQRLVLVADLVGPPQAAEGTGTTTTTPGATTTIAPGAATAEVFTCVHAVDNDPLVATGTVRVGTGVRAATVTVAVVDGEPQQIHGSASVRVTLAPGRTEVAFRMSISVRGPIDGSVCKVTRVVVG